MPRGQRVAALVVLCLILVLTAVIFHVLRHQSVPVEVEERMEELAKFRDEIDSAQIDTTVVEKRKARKKEVAVPVREIEEVPVY